MTFQIHPLAKDQFADLFAMSDVELATRQACRMFVEEKPGAPCRVSLADAEVGETVILLNYQHQCADTPYRASHAIFVRENAEIAEVLPGEVPEVFHSRLISIRCFDQEHMIVDADIAKGSALAMRLPKVFEDPKVAYIHLHWAKHGCFAASVTRAV